MPGPMPDPEAIRHGAAEVIDESPLAPPVPEGFFGSLAEEWVAIWKLPVARYWTTSDLPALERLFRLRQMHETLLTSFEDAPLVAGSKDQVVLNPAGRQAHTVHTELLQLEDRFFLNPAYRLKGQISLAAAIEGTKRAGEPPAEEERPKRADARQSRLVASATEPLGDRG